jgi:ABC-type branched-subunit amino acid transport system ATPase component
MRQRGITVVLVEHHMDLVHAVCESCTVLDFGRVISRGTPDEVTRDPRVLEAYLGGRHHAPPADLPTPDVDDARGES